MGLLTKKITWQEYREMDFPEDDDGLYELLNGNIVKRSSPTVQQQRISKKFFRLLDDFVEKNNLGEVFFVPLDVVLDEINVPQPDLIFISKARNFIIDESKNLLIGTPDLVVEIFPPSTMRQDRGDKMEIYEQFAIREYWLLDPKNQSIEIWEMRENRYKMSSLAVESGKITSAVLDGLSVEVSDLF